MKKYGIVYLILFSILLGLGLMQGIPFGITVYEKDLSMAFHPIIVRDIVLIYNIIIMLACFVIAVILTNQKGNVLKCKWLIPVIMFICLVFLPVGMFEEIQLFPSGHTREFWSIISLIMGKHFIVLN